jgi:hypothetical protein
MKPLFLLGGIGILVSCSAIAGDYISNDGLKQLLKKRPIWCRDLDASGTCSSVMHYGLIEGDTIPVSEYTLLSHPSLLVKLKTSSQAKFNKSGLCLTFNEAYANGLANFVTTNDFARITSEDQVSNEKAQSEFKSKMIDQLRPQFGKEYCGRYEISKRNTEGEISEVKATYFLQDVQQPFPLTFYTLFPEGSENVRLKAMTQ